MNICIYISWKCASLFDIQTYWWICRISRHSFKCEWKIKVGGFFRFIAKKFCFHHFVSWISVARILVIFRAKILLSFRMDHYCNFFFLILFGLFIFFLSPSYQKCMSFCWLCSFIHSFILFGFGNQSSFTFVTHIHIETGLACQEINTMSFVTCLTNCSP